MRRLQVALLVYGASNAILYAGLLPLWDGFDEPFHYGYVNWLRSTGKLPVMGRTPLPDEVVRSLDLVPVSYAVQRNLHRGVPFDAYFALPEAQRVELRRQLNALDPRIPAPPPQSSNYESHQAPLAYLVLAPFDALWSHSPLPARILRLRIAGALFSVALTWLAIRRLARLMALPPAIPVAALFVTFSSQMFYATVCRVSNDWLAVPAWAFFLAECAAFYLRPSASSAIRMMLWLAAGLLTKAYFLSGAPLALILLVICLPRGKTVSVASLLFVPALWYLRNVVLYRNFTGMQETAGGIAFTELAHAARIVPWPRALLVTARTSLWTGNNSLFAFSAKTIGLMLILLAAGICFYIAHAVRAGLPRAERATVAGQICFLVGLVYSTVLTFWYTQGAGISPAPWYLQPLLAPGLLLIFMAAPRLAAAIVWLWAYVLAATYIAKLIPFYAGFNTGRAHLSDLARWWKALLGGSYGTLATTSLIPPPFLLALAIAIVTAAVTLAIALSIILLARRAISSETKICRIR